MSEPDAAATVCGFWDEASGTAGAAWRLAGATGGVVAAEGGVAVAEAAISASNGDTALALDAGAEGLEAVLSLRSRPIPLEPPPTDGSAGGGDGPAGRPGSAGVGAAAICAAAVSRRSGGRRVRCAGQLTTWDADPAEAAGLVRHLAIPAPDGGLVILTAEREPGREDHAAERVGAWLLGADGSASPFAEALLSTQYDGDGLPTRVGLELWPDDREAPAMRAAATALGCARSGEVAAAIVRSSADGTTGIGSYLVWRR